MKNIKALIVEDNDLIRESLSERLRDCGYGIDAVADGRDAMGVFAADGYDVVITALELPNIDGIKLLKHIKKVDPGCVVIVVTASGTVDKVVEVMRAGAFDCMMKPVDIDRLKLTMDNALSCANPPKESDNPEKNLRRRHEFAGTADYNSNRIMKVVDTADRTVPKMRSARRYDFARIIGRSDGIKKVFKTIEKVASTDSTVIIYGETGTGKELVASAIHFNSDRRDYPLIPVNCGAIPEELLESELFGHEKGAFTGAIRSRVGRFELSQGGTIFLDEIGDMSPALQVKLLRVIQERRFERIGGVKTIHVDTRIITATNQDLEKAVSEKRFREDLFYRINVIPVHLPPLRKRKVDIPVLASLFLNKFNRLKKRSVEGIDQEAMNCLMEYRWPGNVRELENLIERFVVMKGEGSIGMEDLPEKMRNLKGKGKFIEQINIPENGLNFDFVVNNFERDLLLKAMNRTNGVKSRAANLLSLNRTTFVEKLKRLNNVGV